MSGFDPNFSDLNNQQLEDMRLECEREQDAQLLDYVLAEQARRASFQIPMFQEEPS